MLDFLKRHVGMKILRLSRLWRHELPLTQEEIEFQFKIPTTKNWLEPTNLWNMFGSSRGLLHPPKRPEPEFWINRVREPQLSKNVPLEVRRLYEVARSVIIYGFLCYPLLLVGIQQLYRVLETAVRLKAMSLGAPLEGEEWPSYSASIQYLKERSFISPEEEERWHNRRKLRNRYSHLKYQGMDTPGAALGTLRSMAERISALFDDAKNS